MGCDIPKLRYLYIELNDRIIQVELFKVNDEGSLTVAPFTNMV